MKAKTFSLVSGSLAILCLTTGAVQADTRGVDVKGADVVGSDVRGSDVRGADVRGGDVTGGSVTGGSVTGGSVSGGTITPGTVTPGVVTASVDGREIRVSAVDAVSINVNGSNAEVKIGDKMLVMEKSRITLDGKPVADLPPETKMVEIQVKEGMAHIKGDNKEVTTVKLK